MSFLFPFTVAITRPGAQPAAVGDQGEAPSADPALETLVIAGIPASIQAKSADAKNVVGLPGDGAKQTWRILVPKKSLAIGVAKNRDVINDNTGRRFQIVADYVGSLGPDFICERLEA